MESGSTLWRFETVLNELGRQGNNFSLIVTPEFLSKAEQYVILPDLRAAWLQDEARAVARRLGTQTYQDLLIFDRPFVYGVIQINHPDGDGRWLKMDRKSQAAKDGHWSSHNLGALAEQLMLIELWRWWANLVEKS
jgi:hypothetical protein